MNTPSQANANLILGVDPRTKPNALQKFLFFISLRQSGNSLLTTGAKGYLMAMSVVMTLVAMAEAVAWGYFGTSFLSTNPLAAGLGMGIFVFLLIWFFDRALLTSDFLQYQHGLQLNGHAKTASDEVKSKHVRRVLVGVFIVRLLIALASLYIAAPYVTQLVFNADIHNKQQAYFQQAVLEVKQNYQNSKATELEQLAGKIDRINQKLQAEIAGRSGSLSGRYGRGASAIAIEQELNTLKSQYQQISTQSKQHIQRIEQALKQRNYAELAALDIRVDKDSPILRRKAIADIKMQYPEAFAQVEHTVQGFLIILAVILLGMKLMQTNAVKLYFSSNLQSKWHQYCLGKYDAFLSNSERRHVLLNSHDALPEEFEQMMIAVGNKKQLHEQLELQAELIAKDKAAQEQADAEAIRLATEQAQEQQRLAQLKQAQAEQSHHERLVIEKSIIEKRERERSLFDLQIQQSLQDISQIEQDYLQKHRDSINQYESTERQLVDELHELDKQYKTQQERVDAKQQRIAETESDIATTQAMLNQINQGEYADRIETLRTIRAYETALIHQSDRLKGQRAELLGFQNSQQFYEENSQLLKKRLNELQVQLENLKGPLYKIDQARAAIETRRVEFVMAQGLSDSPFQPHTEAELPYLVSKLREQMMTVIPN